MNLNPDLPNPVRFCSEDERRLQRVDGYCGDH